MQRCIKDLTDEISKVDLKTTDIPTFLKTAKAAQSSFSQTLDALQASRPFYNDLFKALLKHYHIEFTNFMKTFWNERMKDFDVKLFD